jgi:hypothetical protein
VSKVPTFPRDWGRVEFNRAARAAVVDDNRDMLHLLAEELAKRQLSWRRANPVNQWGRSRLPGNLSLADEMARVGTVAGCAYAATYRKGNFYSGCGSAISNAMDEWLRAGNGDERATWRGGYDSHNRQFGSQQHDGKAAIELLDAAGAPEDIAEEAAPEESAAPSLTADFEREAAGLSAQRVEGQAAERTSHDGGHADDERLNPKDDGERGYGVDGATRGLNTGRIMPTAKTIARVEAFASLSPARRHLLLGIDKAGGFENYVNAGRKHLRAELEQQRARAESELRRAEQEILARGEEEILAAVGVQHTDVPQVPYERPRGVPLPKIVQPYIVGPLSHAPRHKSWRPVIIPLRAGSMFSRRFQGHSYLSHKRLLKQWEPADLLEGRRGGVLWRAWQRDIRRLAAGGWDRPLIMVARRSLLDDA